MLEHLDWGLLLLRVAVGLTIAAHGYNKFMGSGGIAGTARWFDSIGMRPGRVHALLAGGSELVAGLFLCVGLLTPLASAGIIALMLIAAYTVHKGKGFYSSNGGWEYNLILAVAALAIAITGPGRLSIDDALGISSWSGWRGLGVAGFVGLVAGALQLAIFYRPRASVSS